MDIAQDLIYTTSIFVYSKNNDSSFNLMMTIDGGILLKNHVSCNFMLKYYITILLRQFMKTFNQFFGLTKANKNLEICVPVLFEQLNESK